MLWLFRSSDFFFCFWCSFLNSLTTGKRSCEIPRLSEENRYFGVRKRCYSFLRRAEQQVEAIKTHNAEAQMQGEGAQTWCHRLQSETL